MSWNRSDTTPKKVVKKPSAMSKLVLMAVAFILGLCVFFCYPRQQPDSESAKSKDTGRRHISEVVATSSKPGKVESTMTASAPADRPKVFGKTIFELTNGVSSAKSEHHKVDEDPTDFGVTDQLVAMITSQPFGLPPPPVPFVFDEDGGLAEFNASLSKKVVAHKTDDEQKLNTKMAVIDSRIEILEQIKKGETPQTILQDAYQMRVKAAEIRSDMIKDIQDMIDTGEMSEEMFETAVKTFNERLSADGILEITRDEFEIAEEQQEQQEQLTEETK